MDDYIPFLVGGIVLIFALPIIALISGVTANRRVKELQTRVDKLEAELRERPPTPEPLHREEAQPVLSRQPVAVPRPVTGPPPIPARVPKAATPMPPPRPIPAPVFTREPGPQPAPARAPEPEAAPKSAAAAVPRSRNVEEFMGAKLFAWIGGLALFLGIAFFVKYSFEHNLIPPAMRVGIGFIAGVALLAAGAMIKRRENAVTAQTLSATGILVLYAVTYACRCYYHFPFFAVDRTFALMALITAVAFMLSVRMNAMVVAVLGVAGGFLTPLLLSTGQDYALPLFGYIAALDIGLLAIARRQNWTSLPLLGSIGTLLTQAGWFGAFFDAEHYWSGNKIFGAMAVLLVFQFLFLAGAWRARTLKATHAAAAMAGAVSMIGAFFFLSHPSLGGRPMVLFGYLLAVDLALIALSLAAESLAAIQVAAGAAAFIFLGCWTEAYLAHSSLGCALGAYFVFALLHGMLPLLLRRGKTAPAPVWCQLFPLASLGLVLAPIIQFDSLSRLVWPFILLMDCLAFLIAILTAALAPIIAVLLLSLIAIGAALLRTPPDLAGLGFDLFLTGACSVFFLGGSLFLSGSPWAVRRLGGKPERASVAGQLPALSALMPFVLLIMTVIQLPLRDPGAVFGLALLLVVLMLGLTAYLLLDLLPLAALGAALALQYAWMATPAGAAQPLIVLRWGLAFYAAFTLFPFFFRARLAGKEFAWIASALAGPLHFYLFHWAIDAAFPRLAPGLPPAIMAAPPLLALAYLARKEATRAQLAFFGGAALLFITLIFPLQWHREWLTISWALEGAALCWLYRRVAHPGLQWTGVALLAVSFARLALNPLILGYHARAAQPLFNWYLYAFGVVAAAHYLAARLLGRERGRIAGTSVLPLLNTLGTVLLFLLLNLEIADYFTAPGQQVLTLEFSGNFARDMSYSISWALFALVLLLIGIRRRVRAIRYASLGLLGMTVLKLFLHDLSELDQLYRIAAFIAVAIIAIFSSFLYQRFLARAPEEEPPKS